MTTFYELNEGLRALFLTLLFLTTAGYALGLLAFGKAGSAEKIGMTLGFFLDAGMLVLYYAGLRAVYKNIELSQGVKWLWQIPVPITGGVLFLLLLYFLCLVTKEQLHHRHSITKESVKESLDHLPTGLCFGMSDGIVILSNHRMNWLCHQIIGLDLQNANEFWDRICAGDVKPSVTYLRKRDSPELELPDGSIWTFGREVLSGGILQLSAQGTGGLYQAEMQLRFRQQELAAKNIRLSAYRDNVEELSRAKERLETKMRFHDGLGQVLLASRHYLMSGGENADGILQIWRQNMALIREKTQLFSPDPLESLFNAADAIGLQIEIQGEFPADISRRELFSTAALEAMTNAVQHGGAHRLIIRLTQEEGLSRICIKNDGTLPEHRITEGGGLTGLRQKVEQRGGRMQVKWMDGFELCVELPVMEDGEI